MIRIKRYLVRVLSVFLFLTLNGCESGEITGHSFAPSADDAKAYVLQNGLLKSVAEVRHTRPGPVVTMLIGQDARGNEKVVWLNGDSKGNIRITGSVLLKDGIARNDILSKLKERGFDPEKIDDIYVAPLDYNGTRIAWLVTLQSPDQHSFVFDFRTGQLLVENYQKTP